MEYLPTKLGNFWWKCRLIFYTWSNWCGRTQWWNSDWSFGAFWPHLKPWVLQWHTYSAVWQSQGDNTGCGKLLEEGLWDSGCIRQPHSSYGHWSVGSHRASGTFGTVDEGGRLVRLGELPSVSHCRHHREGGVTRWRRQFQGDAKEHDSGWFGREAEPTSPTGGDPQGVHLCVRSWGLGIS